MDIVEEFGSYEAALDKLRMFGLLRTEILWHKDIPLNKSTLIDWIAIYRKQHGIYWEGDYVLLNDPASEGRVYKIAAAQNGYYKVVSAAGRRYCKGWRIARHATDKEVKEMGNESERVCEEVWSSHC